MADDAPIAAARLQEHTKEDDCWLAIHGKVYDVTKYLLEHPGGMDIMLEHAGKDATEEFEYYGHSDKAREQMAAFLVGTYEDGDPAPVKSNTPAVAAAAAPASLPIKIIQALLPLLLLVAAFLVKTYADRPQAAAAPAP